MDDPFPTMQVQGRINDLLHDPAEDAARVFGPNAGLLRTAARDELPPSLEAARPELAVCTGPRRDP